VLRHINLCTVVRVYPASLNNIDLISNCRWLVNMLYNLIRLYQVHPWCTCINNSSVCLDIQYICGNNSSISLCIKYIHGNNSSDCLGIKYICGNNSSISMYQVHLWQQLKYLSIILYVSSTSLWTTQLWYLDLAGISLLAH